MSTITELAAQLAEAIEERDTAATALHEAQAKVDDLSSRMTDRAKHAPKPPAKAKRGTRRTPAGRAAKPAGDTAPPPEHGLNGMREFEGSAHQ